jgi:diguanylate cyclase (GGDEF)-like protein
LASGVFERLVKTQRLPSPPATALRVLELADRENVSIAEIADAIAADPAISARLLKYANSPLVAPSQEITTIQRSVVLLGIRAVKVTALGFSLVKKQNLARCPHFEFDLFWAHAAATATAARGIVAATSPGKSDEAFVAGLLARIGKLAFATAIPEEYDAVLAKTGCVMQDGAGEEREAFGTDSIEIGTELLSRWKLPSLLVEAVRHQANPNGAPDEDSRLLANAVLHGRQIADALCGLVVKSDAVLAEQLASSSLEQVEQQFKEVASVLDLSLKALPEPAEIEDRARDLLEEMSVATQTKNIELEQQALVDSLTGIGNRKAFDQQLAAELERVRRYKHPVSLLMMDLDRFKRVNDTYGHVAGDMVLKATAERIKQVLRRCDFAARYGGEEFAVVAGETDLKAAAQLAERLRRAIQDEPISCSNGELRVTVSIGTATLSPADADVDPVSLTAAADEQLYAAKAAGRNRCCSRGFKPSAAVGCARV